METENKSKRAYWTISDAADAMNKLYHLLESQPEAQRLAFEAHRLTCEAHHLLFEDLYREQAAEIQRVA